MQLQESFEKGYVSGVATSLKSSCSSSTQSGGYGWKSTSIFQLVIPAELVEETLNELLPLLSDGDIIIDHGNSNFKDSRKRAERLSKLGIQYIDCGTSGGVYGLERGYCLMVGGATGAVSVCAPIFVSRTWAYPLRPAQIHTATQHLLSMGGYIVEDLAQVIS